MVRIADNIFWLGTRDWELESFHGREMSTAHGSSYNSYLVRDKKTALIDTCRTTKKDEYIDIIEKEVGFENIDLIVVNHSEPDHGGMLIEILNRIGSKKPVYCTEMGRKFITKFFGPDINIQVVKTGDEISLGDTTLRFIEMRMIHWPDSMMTYVPERKVLFSNDAFGQHISSGNIFDEDADECVLIYEALKYYVNILGPFGRLIKNKLTELALLKLDISYIAPSHGLIWNKHIAKIMGLYDDWSKGIDNGSVSVIYETMYGGSADIAKAIGRGLENKGMKYDIHNVSSSDTSDLITGIFLAKGVVVGGPTVNGSILSGLSGLLEKMRALKLQGKVGAAFGMYGWSGEAGKIIKESLIGSGLRTDLEPLSVLLKMSEDEKQKCIKYGEDFALLVRKE
jgi:anaerobic nitric oxide reductase flavorubredoxin